MLLGWLVNCKPASATEDASMTEADKISISCMENVIQNRRCSAIRKAAYTSSSFTSG